MKVFIGDYTKSNFQLLKNGVGDQYALVEIEIGSHYEEKEIVTLQFDRASAMRKFADYLNALAVEFDKGEK